MIERSDFHHSTFVNRPSSFKSPSSFHKFRCQFRRLSHFQQWIKRIASVAIQVLFNKNREWSSRENMDINMEGISAGSTLKINAAIKILGISRQAGFA
jgi:hypothetical protein